MSWVRQAIDEIKAQSHEELYPTAYGGSAKQPDILWALDPNDVPPPVRHAVEKAVREQTLRRSLTCAIIRLETLPAYYSPSTTKPDEPVGHFAIYLGVSPAATDFEAHLPADLGNPPATQPKAPPANGPGRGTTPRHSTSAAGDVDTDRHDGTRTPSLSEIEAEYGRVEERSNKRTSRLAAGLDKWVRSK